MSPFTVDTSKDSGYKASNSIGGTRSNTPIKDIPLNIQVFTKDLTDDLIITNQIELERYNAALVNGNADVHSDNPIQQAYNAFLFRGFIQNWGLRDGIRQYDPVDTQGLSRVEVVKGPAAPLYGLTYPGGVMNSITKEVDFKKNFSSIRLSAQNEGGYRGAVDANFSGKVGEGKMGVRYNGAHAVTKDTRDNSEGSVEYSQVVLAWQPTSSTEVKFLAETGYRDKPNNLGYFSRGETNAQGAALGNGADIPLQIASPSLNIPWTWNVANDNMRSLETKLYRGSITQSVGENLTLTGYLQFSDRVNIDSEGLDASGGGGSAASWDMGWSSDTREGDSPTTGWMTVGTGANRKEIIRMAYHHRDWRNSMHTMGATAIYKLETGALKNIFTAGGASWKENFISHKGTLHNGSKQYVDFDVKNGLMIDSPKGPPGDYFMDIGGAFGPEYNKNTYYFGSWQGSMLDNRLRLNASVNHTSINLVQYSNGLSTAPSNTTDLSKTSPMIGGMFDITKEVSLFVVHSTSIFPTTDKNSFLVQMPAVTGKSFEGGVKVELLNGKISGTISYYEISQRGGSQTDSSAANQNTQRWDGMTAAQRIASFPGKTRTDLLGDLVPGGTQKSKGFEADLVFQPTKEWQIMLSYANNDQKVTEALNKASIGQSTGGHIKNQVALLTKYSFREGVAKGLFVGAGLQKAGQALQDYSVPGGKARFTPGTSYAELFTGYKFKAGGYEQSIQLNAKNLTQQAEYVGWRATGSSSVYATERYSVPTTIRWTLSYGIDF